MQWHGLLKWKDNYNTLSEKKSGQYGKYIL